MVSKLTKEIIEDTISNIERANTELNDDIVRDEKNIIKKTIRLAENLQKIADLKADLE